MAESQKGKGNSNCGVAALREEIKPVSVQLGITDNRNTEIVGGDLKVGDRVITGENNNGNASGKPSSVGMRMF